MNDHIEMMRLAEKEALKSVCKRAQVGAVFHAPDWSLYEGHNHNPDGSDCECEQGKTKSEVVHAETAAIEASNYRFNFDEDGKGIMGGTLYVTRQPCIDCAGLIVHVGIEQVFYRDADDKTDGLELLAAHGVKVDSGWIQGQVQLAWQGRWAV